jgi:16S rRNA (guanine966-N2)-methyltransferase
MRIVAGSHRGRAIAAPADSVMRPTADRVRENIFNILAHGRLGEDGASPLQDARVLDACAGSGALGLEALSRGAAHAVFLDQDPTAL